MTPRGFLVAAVVLTSLLLALGPCSEVSAQTKSPAGGQAGRGDALGDLRDARAAVVRSR